MQKKFYAVCGYFVLISLSVTANVRKGNVRDATNGEILAGVSVHIRNSVFGTVTDDVGEYLINALDSDTLVFSYLGYLTDEEFVGGRERIDVVLVEDREILDEVVVVGYGTQRRKELTGAISTVNTSFLDYNASLSVDGLLAGAVAGLNVTQESGQPGGGSEIRIRGGNSIYASNEPLYVIDGFIYFSEKDATQAGVSGIEGSLNPLSSINASDIESIEVLKDVSAKAIYGSRGANGVILVTTRKGDRRKNVVRYQYSIGIDNRSKKIDLLNARQFEDINRVELANTTPWNSLEAKNYQFADTDWQDAVFRTGIKQTHEVSASGGDDKTRYLFSGNYTQQTGIVLNSGFSRFSGRINVDKKLYDNLTVSVNATGGRYVQDALTTLAANDYKGSSSPFKSGITNSLVYALFMPPVLSVYDSGSSDGYNHYNPFEQSELSYYGVAANPVADLEMSIGQTVGTSLLGQLSAKYDIAQVKGLAVKFSAGSNINYITQNFFAPPNTVLGINQDIQGRGSVGNRRTDVTQTETLVTYTGELSQDHYIDLLSGYTSQKTVTNIILTRAIKLEDFDNLAFGKELPLFNLPERAELHSVLGRVNYTFRRKYNLTATIRADRSSRFAEGNRWSVFPSIGASWNVSDEDFFRHIAGDFINTVKIRGTYGKAGNQEIGFSEFASRLTASRYGNEPATVIANAGNRDLRWETTEEFNAGIDAGAIDNRLKATFDVYRKKTANLLTKKYLPLEAIEQTVNFGSLTNAGFEVAVGFDIVRQNKLQWDVAANFARNVNTVTSLIQDNYLTGESGEQIFKVGYPAGSFYGYIYDGVSASGDVILRDLNDDQRIDRDNDRTVIGSVQPDFTYGFNTTFTAGRWDIFVSLQGSQGNEIYNKLRRHLSENNTTHNLSTEVLNAWTPANPSADVPKLGVYISKDENYSRYIEDASYIKLRNVTAGYTLPVGIAASQVKLRFFISAQNLLTFTKYLGYDPEIASGVDTGVYPSAKTLQFGVKASF
ncbi:MAG: SusC/RagA family TonB-linked outer membrane protein [Dysgonamonadaceae bacterium]|jgi:TonB-linked SusC/RagA family outer membrane protein|nr:SusC/RagA family TonB-linked outer membrane protein [Dysgonamonadaceae bacterium]